MGFTGQVWGVGWDWFTRVGVLEWDWDAGGGVGMRLGEQRAGWTHAVAMCCSRTQCRQCHSCAASGVRLCDGWCFS